MARDKIEQEVAVSVTGKEEVDEMGDALDRVDEKIADLNDETIDLTADATPLEEVDTAASGAAESTRDAGDAATEAGTEAADAGEEFDFFGATMLALAAAGAAVSAALDIATGIQENLNEEAQAAAEAAIELGDALRETSDAGLAFADINRDNVAELRELSAQLATQRDLMQEYFAVLGKEIPVVGGLIEAFADGAGQDLTDAVSSLLRAEVSMYQLSAAAEDLAENGLLSAGAYGEYVDQLNAAYEAGRITRNEFDALLKLTNEQAKSFTAASEANKLWNVDLAEANALLGELVAKEAPLSQFTDQWRVLIDDIADGAIDTQLATIAINELADGLGLTTEEVIALAREEAIARDETEQLGGVADETADDITKLGTAFDNLRDKIDLDQAVLDLEGDFQDLEAAAAEAWAKGVEGSDDAAEAQRKYQTEQNTTKQNVIDYGEEIGLLPTEVETVLELIDNGEVAAAQAELNNLQKTYTARLRITPYYAALDSGYARPGIPGGDAVQNDLNAAAATSTSPVPAAAPVITPVGGSRFLGTISAAPSVTNVTVNLPAAAQGRDVVRSVERWNRVNGRT